MHPGMYVVGRLKPGVTQAQAQSEMTAIAARLAEAYPKSNSKHGVNVTPLTGVIVGNVRPHCWFCWARWASCSSSLAPTWRT